MKHAQIIEKWPSQRQMARDLDVSHFAVNKWYKRDAIPSEHWRRLVEEAQKRGIYLSYEMLVEGVAA
jgi:DNA-binding transcriptional regulator YhcF (GntR family)